MEKFWTLTRAIRPVEPGGDIGVARDTQQISESTPLRGSSPHFSPGFVARRFKGAAFLAFATEGRAGVVDTTLSSPTE